MQNFMVGFAAGLLALAVALVSWKIARRGRGGRRDPRTPAVTHESFITSMKAVGELNVFRIMTKEVISASDHWLGEFGRKYLNWLFSSQRITLVIEFDVDFRYDLADPAFAITPRGEGGYLLTLPPCRHEVRIRDMRIHSEDKTELLPWLMPEVIGRVFTGGFSVEAKNKLITETRVQASRLAGDLVQRTSGEAQRSASLTLGMLAQGLGASRVDFNFLPPGDFRPRVDSTVIEGGAGNGPDRIRPGGF